MIICLISRTLLILLTEIFKQPINNFDEEELRTALKGADELLLGNGFQGNMSKNKAECFQDEMDIMPPLAISVCRRRKVIIRQQSHRIREN